MEEHTSLKGKKGERKLLLSRPRDPAVLSLAPSIHFCALYNPKQRLVASLAGLLLWDLLREEGASRQTPDMTPRGVGCRVHAPEHRLPFSQAELSAWPALLHGRGCLSGTHTAFRITLAGNWIKMAAASSPGPLARETLGSPRRARHPCTLSGLD